MAAAAAGTLSTIVRLSTPFHGAGRAPERTSRKKLSPSTPLAAQADALRGLGHQVQVRRHEGGLSALRRDADGWQGAADPRLATSCSAVEVAGPGFVNLTFRPEFLAAQLVAAAAD